MIRVLRASIIVAWTALCLISNSAFGLSAENQGTPKPETEAVLAAAREIVQKVRLCGLVTVDDFFCARRLQNLAFDCDSEW